MITKNQIESRGFVYYTNNEPAPSNNFRGYDLYLSVAKVGEAEYLVELQYFTDGLLAIRDKWNDPLYYPEYYFKGEVLTEEDLDNALSFTRFDTFEELDITTIYQYK